jgi:putative membrane protein
MLRRMLGPVVVSAALLTLGAGGLALADGGGDSHGDNGDHGSSHEQKCDRSCGSRRYSSWDEEWLMMSIQGDLFEIQGGRIAQDKATTEQAKALGARLVKDHTQSLSDATELAQKLGIDVPDSPSPSQQWELRAVQQFMGTQFDKWYADLEVQDHIQDISEAQDEVDKGCNRKVRKDAQDEIPMLQEHLKLAQDVLASVS